MFDPKAGDRLNLLGTTYEVSPHPKFAGMPYGQRGRQGVVYKLAGDQVEPKALKIFLPAYQTPSMVYMAEQLNGLAQAGLSAAKRSVLTPQNSMEILDEHNALLYSVLMPWIEGKTWFDLLSDRKPLAVEDALQLAKGLANALSSMEQRGLAHCDLSSANVIVRYPLPDGDNHDRNRVELIDLEQMYAGHLTKPEHAAMGTPGYTSLLHKEQLLWGKSADRFAGGVLIAEMLGWISQEICDLSWGDSFFDPDLMERDTVRAEALRHSLARTYGEAVADLFDRLWHSKDLFHCPNFGEWCMALSSKRILLDTGRMMHTETIHGKHSTESISPVATETHEQADARSVDMAHPEERLREQLEAARKLEDSGQTREALDAYMGLLEQTLPSHPLYPEIETAIGLLAGQLHHQAVEKKPVVKPASAVKSKRRSLSIGAIAVGVLFAAGIAVWGAKADWGAPKPEASPEPQLALAASELEAPLTSPDATATVKPEATSKSPDATATVKPEATPKSPDASAAPKPEATPKSPDASAAPKPEATPKSQTAATATPKPEATPKSQTAATATPKPEATPKSQAAATATPKPEATPKSQAAATATPKPEASSKVKKLERELHTAYYINDDRDAAIDLINRLLAIDSDNVLANQIWKEVNR